jgi:putative CocE/NonD family hydrolase
MILFASSSAVDTDWFATLYEYNEKGKYLRLGQGKIRARFRQSTSKPQPLKPGEIYEYTLDLWQTGITIPAGSRLRIEVASASFPLFSRNLNTGGHNEMETKYVAAEQTIFHDLSHPSRVILPMIEKVD